MARSNFLAFQLSSFVVIIFGLIFVVKKYESFCDFFSANSIAFDIFDEDITKLENKKNI